MRWRGNESRLFSFGNRAFARSTWPHVVKWRAHLRGFGADFEGVRGGGGGGGWSAGGELSVEGERLADDRVVIAVGNRDRLKLTRAARIYRGEHGAHRHATLCHPENVTYLERRARVDTPLFLVNSAFDDRIHPGGNEIRRIHELDKRIILINRYKSINYLPTCIYNV